MNTAYVKRVHERFGCSETEFVGFTLVSNDSNHDIPLDAYNYVQDICVSNDTISCPSRMCWRLKPLKEHNTMMPFLPIFPYDCDRRDGRFFNSMWNKIHVKGWAALQFPEKTNGKFVFSIELYTGKRYASATWITLQHAQIIIDLMNELCDASTEDVVRHLCYAQTSLCNFKTTGTFLQFCRIENQLYMNNLIESIKYGNVCDLRDLSHPIQFIESIYKVQANDCTNLDLSTKLIYMVALNELPDIGWICDNLDTCGTVGILDKRERSRIVRFTIQYFLIDKFCKAPRVGYRELLDFVCRSLKKIDKLKPCELIKIIQNNSSQTFT